MLQVDISERYIRTDGLPYANARYGTNPGVIVSFDSRHGPLRYATDAFTEWQDNLRAIALSLEALRAVDRYGVTRRGEQYTGWRAIAAPAPEFATADHAEAWMRGVRPHPVPDERRNSARLPIPDDGQAPASRHGRRPRRLGPARRRPPAAHHGRPTMTSIDEGTQEAIDALVYRIRDRGEADLEIIAREFMLELRERHGWRPTDARRVPWKVPPGDSPQPDPDKPGGAEYASVRAQPRGAQPR